VRDKNDTPPTDEETALARQGEARIAAAVADARAPQSLRESIERERERAAARGATPFWRQHRWALTLAGTAVVALVAAAIALVPGGGATEPSLGQVYAAADLEPTGSAPAPAGGDPPVLDARVDALEFPDWREAFGWRAVGRREDDLDGRPVTTVYYRNAEGARLGYAVVGGAPLGGAPAGDPVERKGNTYNVARAEERTIVTWTQDGHTCAIVAPSAVPESTLVDLAASRNV
jgi:hypothetical protein